MLVELKNIRAQAKIGLHRWEEERTQLVLITFRLRYDPTAAIESDTEEHILNYETIANQIIAEVEASQFRLLESLTDYVLGLIMERPQVQWAEVTCSKPEVLANICDNVSVTAEAER